MAQATTSKPTELRALTGIRILAAAWVVAYHFRDDLVQLLPGFRIIDRLSLVGYFGVDLFFFLSGFIIAYNYLNSFGRPTAASYARFLWLRLARIYPVHLATLLVLVVMFLVARLFHHDLNNVGVFTLPTLVANLFLVHKWGPFPESWNYPAWSISAEWFAYLLFPLIAIGLVRVRSGAVALVFASISILVMLLFNYVTNQNLNPASTAPHLELIRVVGEFSAGACLYVVYRCARMPTSYWTAGAAIAMAAVIVLCQFAGALAPGVVVSLGLLVLATSRSGGAVRAVLASRPFVFGGRVSYSLYMTHAIVLIVLHKLLPAAAFAGARLGIRAGVAGIYVLVFSVAAVAMYALVEEPARMFLRRIVAQPPKVDRPAPGSAVVNESVTAKVAL